MSLSPLDLAIIVAFFVVTLGIGIAAGRRSGKSPEEFFLSGRNMPWWLLGISMVATTFATDTPNFVAQVVRTDGVSGNWIWWAFLFSSILTVFVFARLWRRSGVMTDIEFYEIRYAGRSAAFLRGFRAVYLGLIFNVLVMGNVCLAAVKFGEIVLGIDGWLMLVVSGTVIVLYSAIGGLRGIILTDLFQFGFAMVGSILACYLVLRHDSVGGLDAVLANPNVATQLSIFPDFSEPAQWMPLLLVPLAVQWWGSYYPGMEPGGGGYVVQRMLAAKNEKHAVGAALFFNFAHYALRPWPWILIALASLVVFPTTDSLAAAFPKLDPDSLSHDSAYPAMLTLLPAGVLGLVVASLLAAFLSTMSTQVNLGSSYFVNDFYRRFIHPSATARHLVVVGRISTIVMVAMACGLGLVLKDAKQAFELMLLIGAGTGGIYIMRWFWWRISATTEIVAMISALVVASTFTFFIDWQPQAPAEQAFKVALPVLLTTALWVACAFFGPQTDRAVLRAFYRRIRPAGPGWRAIRAEVMQQDPTTCAPDPLPISLAATLIATCAIYTTLIAIGLWIYGQTIAASLLTAIAAACALALIPMWKRIFSPATR